MHVEVVVAGFGGVLRDRWRGSHLEASQCPLGTLLCVAIQLLHSFLVASEHLLLHSYALDGLEASVPSALLSDLSAKSQHPSKCVSNRVRTPACLER